MERFNPDKTLKEIMQHSTGKVGPYEAFANERYVDKGRDSVVYKFPEYGLVAKLYTNQGWNKNEGFYYLSQYRYQTNRAGELSLAQDWRMDFGNMVDIPVRVNLYAGLVYSDFHSCWVGFSQYMQSSKIWETEFDKNFKYEHEFLSFLRNIDRKINFSLGTVGVEMDPVNVKFLKSGYYPRGCVMVTDLCIQIGDLKETKQIHK